MNYLTIFLVLLLLPFIQADTLTVGSTGGDEIVIGYGNQIEIFFTGIDQIHPTINITFPTNGSTHSFSGWINLTLNVSATDFYGISSMWYSTNNGLTNQTFSNSTGIHFEQGNSVTKSYTIIVWVNDTANNLNSTSTYVTIKQTTPIGQGSGGGATFLPGITICDLVYDFIIDRKLENESKERIMEEWEL